MKRNLLIGAAVVAVLLLGGGAGAYAYFFSGLRSAPQPLALASPSPAATAASSAPGDPTGTWRVASGSQVGYRVREQFIGQSAAHEAVARTSDVSGTLTVEQGSGALTASNLSFSAQVAGLKSVDQVAGYNVGNRDRIVSSTLQVTRFPTASFLATSVALPADVGSGGLVSLQVPGKLTVHGVTRDATASVTVQVTGSQAQVVGTVKVNMTDFGMQPPSVGFTSVEDATTIEFQLVMTRG
jgi:polyisoprenoid-binding protein YceI